MRRRFGILLPIVMLALLAQIFAPIGACWARSATIADPLRAAEICIGKTGTATDGSSSGQPMAMHDCCSACSLAHAPATPADPQPGTVLPTFEFRLVEWRDVGPSVMGQHRDRNAQARAPPMVS